MLRSEKVATKKKEEKKEDLTPEELDRAKYMGQLTGLDEKKPIWCCYNI